LLEDISIQKCSELVAFDGSVTDKRTQGLLSARCNNEEANFLALNLSHDIITVTKNF
jgi:hypothetical protein